MSTRDLEFYADRYGKVDRDCAATSITKLDIGNSNRWDVTAWNVTGIHLLPRSGTLEMADWPGTNAFLPKLSRNFLGAKMGPAPRVIAGAVVLFWSTIDARHKFTGRCRHFVNGELQGAMASLAICRYAGEESVYVFGCDDAWNVVTDSCHSTLDEAFMQAEFEYEGISKTWQRTS